MNSIISVVNICPDDSSYIPFLSIQDITAYWNLTPELSSYIANNLRISHVYAEVQQKHHMRSTQGDNFVHGSLTGTEYFRLVNEVYSIYSSLPPNIQQLGIS